MVYILSNILQLTVGSHDLSQAEKNVVVDKLSNSQNVNYFNSNFHSGPFFVEIVVILGIYSACKGHIF